jgi:hypothetical protein
MADGTVSRSSRGHRTICLPVSEDAYARAVHDPAAFRGLLDEGFRTTPELFPANCARGYELKDDRMSVKQGLLIRRILVKDGAAYSIRPSFLMPYMTARVAAVEGPLFLRKFGVPCRALAHVFGADPMSWYRQECALGRFSVVGTTVRRADVPAHLLADEHHQPRDGQKVYIATTVGGGCCLGAEPAEAAGIDDLKAAYAVFKAEARDVTPKYAPQDRQHGRLEGDASGLEVLVPAGGHSPVLLARMAQDPGPGQAPEGPVHGSLAAGLGGVPRPRSPGLRPTIASAPGVGRWAPQRGCAGDRPGPVPQGPSVRGGVSSPRRPPHEHHARPPDAGDEPVLRPRSTPPRLAGRLPTPLPGVGAVVELRAVAPGDSP